MEVKKGSKQSPAARLKMSISRKGHAPWNKGKQATEEHKKAISNGMMGIQNAKGCKWSDEARKQRSLSLLGNKRAVGSVKSEELKKYLSEKLSGENNPKYKHGMLRKQANWSNKIKQRDNYKCVICKKHKNQLGKRELHAHHINPKAEFPEQIYDIDNGITLCNVHHRMYEFKPLLLMQTVQNLNIQMKSNEKKEAE
jgi:5-methylcytosine-specific restriction endonuclease McrA